MQIFIFHDTLCILNQSHLPASSYIRIGNKRVHTVDSNRLIAEFMQTIAHTKCDHRVCHKYQTLKINPNTSQ
jgi:hypothetical protein